MATPTQILANRENARHSTGPRTVEGKAACANNATRHSLTARGLIIPIGLEAAFQDFETELRINLIPNVGLEETLFTRILESGWNLHRCRLAQAQLLESDPTVDPFLNDTLEPKFARLDKYARQFENSMYKGMRELSRIQTEAQYRHEIHPLTEEERADPEQFEQAPQSLSAICDFAKVQAAAVKRPKTRSFQNRADSERAAFAILDRLTAPPTEKAA